jgi:poly(3-hydroxybutyrate) depolymerase
VNGNHIYTFPADYDGNTPFPLVFGFHANGNPIDQIKTLTEDSELPNDFVMAFPKSAGAGWVLNTDRQHVQDNYDELLENHCIDTNRIFATGHSSGAQLIVQFMCADDQRWTAIAPVASSVYCNGWDPIPTLLIHGRNDTERGSTSQDADGRKDLAPYVSSNGCGMTTMPKTVAGCSSSGTQVMPGCVDYQGCSQPLTWCSHNDPFYSNTNHGWPCFAADLMHEFFSSF